MVSSMEPLAVPTPTMTDIRAVYYDETGRHYGYADYGNLGGYYGYLDYPYYGANGYPYTASPVQYGYGGMGYGGMGYGGMGYGGMGYGGMG